MMFGLLLCASFASAQDIAVHADLVHTVSGPTIENGVVLVRDGRIRAVGSATEIDIPEDVRVIRGSVAVPGLIDALSVAGLSGPYNDSTDQDHRERGDSATPELRALDAYDGYDPLVGYLRDRGVTTVQTGPSPGTPIGGRTLLTSTAAGNAEDVSWVNDHALVFTLGEAAKGGHGTSTRMGSAARIRQELARAQDYQLRRTLALADRPATDLGLDALVEALEGRRQVIVHAHAAEDILTALRIADEFQLDLQIAGGAEAYLVRDTLAAADVPVLVGPVMLRSWGQSGERSHATFENAFLLEAAGVEIGFISGFEGYVPKIRLVLWEAGIAATNGLGAERALKALTLGNARLLGLDHEIGSLEVGKVADIVVFDGDPFEYTSHACAVVVGGLSVSETCR